MNSSRPKTKAPTRRTFLKSALGAGAALTTLSSLGCGRPSGKVRVEKPQTPPEERKLPQRPTRRTPYSDLRVAFIGTGGIGGYHLENTAETGIQCPCFCDVDTGRYRDFPAVFPEARPYQDYREMFDKEHKNIDAVMIGTPDHHHYPATMIALQLGKHVYTQKPLTHTPWEARQLTQAAQRYKVATQMGNQGHALEGWRLLYEWIHSGAIGRVREVHTWTDRPIWPQGMDRPAETDPVPGNLNWDLWLGPAPERPFKEKTYHPFVWRGWWDFGCGALGDMACHTMDGIFWALDPGYPAAVEPVGMTPMNNESFPKATIIKWEFPAKGERPAFVTYWYDGGLMPPLPPELELGRKLGGTGNLFLGTKGALLVGGDYGESPRIIPETRMKEVGKPPQMLERSPGHVLEWLMACVGEKPYDYPKSNFAYAGPFTEAILLGNIALRLGRRLEWDGPNLRFTNIDEANQYVSKEYRPGWKF